MSTSIDLALLRILKYRDRYDRLYGMVPQYALDDKTKIILKDFGLYFEEFPEHSQIDTEYFPTWFFGFRHKKLDDEKQTLYRKLFHSIQVDADEHTQSGIVDRMLELGYATRCANLLSQYNDGEEVNLLRALEDLTETHKTQIQRKLRIPWINDPIEELLEADEHDHGLHWRLEALNTSMRALRPGDFGVVAARPDAGKTSFFASEVTHMVSQFPDVYSDGATRNALWFNNEGPGWKIVTRSYQAALNKTTKELIQMKNNGTIVPAYREACRGRIDAIRILDVHDYWSHDVVEIVEQSRPGLIIFDMIDNIKFGGMQGAPRTDQVLEQMYQWARILGVRYDCPVLATSQISNEGDGLQFPTLGMLKDSKTGKQGASDFQLMIGKTNDPCMQLSRFLSLPKNKLHKEGGDKDPRVEVYFDALRGRYNMPTENGGIC